MRFEIGSALTEHSLLPNWIPSLSDTTLSSRWSPEIERHCSLDEKVGIPVLTFYTTTLDEVTIDSHRARSPRAIFSCDNNYQLSYAPRNIVFNINHTESQFSAQLIQLFIGHLWQRNVV